jgi:hypothetical protein
MTRRGLEGAEGVEGWEAVFLGHICCWFSAASGG